jgi:hypothetical protein
MPVVKSDQEAASIPVTEPVTIDVGSLDTPPAPATTSGPPGTVPVQQAPVSAPPIAAEPEPDLLKQLDDMRSAEAAARKQAQEAAAREAQARQEAQRHATTAWQTKQSAEQSQYDAVANALNAAQQQAEMAEAAYAAALAGGDNVQAARQMRAMTEASARIVTLQSGKDELEQRIASAKTQQPPQLQQQAQPQNIDELLGRMPNLMPQEKDWIREHPDSLLDPANQRRMDLAFTDAVQRGIIRGTPEYFEFFEDRLGYKKMEQRTSEEREERAPASGGPRYGAPVTRGGSSGGSAESKTRVTLTPQERDAARISGISEVEYARGKLKMLEAKRAGLIQQ